MSSRRGGKGSRWAVLTLACLVGAGAATALHAPPPPVTVPENLPAELERAQREQKLLRAESSVRLLRALEARPPRRGSAP